MKISAVPLSSMCSLVGHAVPLALALLTSCVPAQEPRAPSTPRGVLSADTENEGGERDPSPLHRFLVGLEGHARSEQLVAALSEALAWSARLSQTAGNAVASVKNLVEHARSRSLREQLDAEREQFTANLQHDNAAEGLRAFFEKCKPRFS